MQASGRMATLLSRNPATNTDSVLQSNGGGDFAFYHRSGAAIVPGTVTEWSMDHRNVSGSNRILDAGGTTVALMDATGFSGNAVTYGGSDASAAEIDTTPCLASEVGKTKKVSISLPRPYTSLYACLRVDTGVVSVTYQWRKVADGSSSSALQHKNYYFSTKHSWDVVISTTYGYTGPIIQRTGTVLNDKELHSGSDITGFPSTSDGETLRIDMGTPWRAPPINFITLHVPNTIKTPISYNVYIVTAGWSNSRGTCMYEYLDFHGAPVRREELFASNTMSGNDGGGGMITSSTLNIPYGANNPRIRLTAQGNPCWFQPLSISYLE